MAERPEKQFGEKVGHKAERKRRARREKEGPVWFWLGMFGLVGDSVDIPTIIGVAIGVWLDRRFSGEASWTLTFLFIGVVIGCINAWYWVKQESRRR